MTDHSWVVELESAAKLKRCTRCGAVVIQVTAERDGDQPGSITDYLLCVGDGAWTESRPAPVCPPDCETTADVWDAEVVKTVMEQ